MKILYFVNTKITKVAQGEKSKIEDYRWVWAGAGSSLKGGLWLGYG